MAVTSPTSASPGLSLLDWDETAVHSFLSDLGVNQYEEAIIEHGISGEVLCVMDHSSLQDIGMGSLGQRLAVLRAVWELKKEQGIPLGEDDWRPQDGDALPATSQAQMARADKLWEMIMEQHERLMHLERDHARMLTTLEENGINVPVATSADGDDMRGLQGIPGVDMKGGGQKPVGLVRGSSLKWRNEKKGSDGDDGEAKHARRNSGFFSSSLNSSAPLTSDSATFQESYTPTTTNAPAYPFDSPSQTHGNLSKPTQIAPPPFTRLMSGSSILDASVSSPPAGSSRSTPPSGQSGSSSSLRAPQSLASSTSSNNSAASEPSDKAKSSAKDAARSAAKSFRVTLEDPCWKVLPAALKKYKINDDWKMYALFICFGNTERCLSYDEKPLMLFQKLKESGQRPVFMLRHIRDIKSPIAVAQQKQAIKLGLPANSTVNVLPSIKSDSNSPTKPHVMATNQSLRAGDEGQTPSGGAFPELPSPGLREGDTSIPVHGKSGPVTGSAVDKDGNPQRFTYAISIYPYIADRQDEFDVAVGATFVILSKAKGWWIVQKDPEGMGNVLPDQSKSGWVPAGCLLELSTPISAVSPTSPESSIPGRSPLPPSAIMSSSYPGVVLMDYEAKGEDELSLKEGDKIRVYKKYCHWSYSILQDTGQRGWVPAWFIGKLAGTSSENSPSSAATPSTAIQSAASIQSSDTVAAVEGGKEEGGYEV